MAEVTVQESGSFTGGTSSSIVVPDNSYIATITGSAGNASSSTNFDGGANFSTLEWYHVRRSTSGTKTRGKMYWAHIPVGSTGTINISGGTSNQSVFIVINDVDPLKINEGYWRYGSTYTPQSDFTLGLNVCLAHTRYNDGLTLNGTDTTQHQLINSSSRGRMHIATQPSQDGTSDIYYSAFVSTDSGGGIAALGDFGSLFLPKVIFI